MGMKGNTRGTYGNGYKVTGECRGMPWVLIIVQSARGMHGNARDCAKCQRNAGGEEILGERM